MFGLATGLYKTYFSPATLSVLIIGPDCAGKTALLERLKVTQFSTARQLRHLAASNGGTVPLPQTPSGHKIRGGNDDNDGRQQHKRHSSAPELLNGTNSDEEGAAAAEAVAQTPPKQKRPPEPQTRDTPGDKDGSPSKAQPSAGGDGGPARRQDSNASGASASSFRRRFLICPAPRMYSREAMTDGDDDEEEIFDEVQLSARNSSSGLDNTKSQEVEDLDADLDDLLGMESQHSLDKAASPTTGSTAVELHGDHDDGGDGDGDEHEHDLKPAARMLPLHLIRPTIGQNLAKIDACGCRLNIWDLGGVDKMRPLWDRYYAEVDAVVFVVDARTVGGAGGSGGISRLQETVDSFDAVRRQPMLEGIPLMVFVNKVDRGEGGRLVPEDDDGDSHDKHHGGGDRNGAVDGDRFLPSRVDLDVLSNAFDLSSGGGGTGVSDDMVVMTAGSARTGEGVRSSFEWLVLKARNVQRETQQRRDRTMTS